MIPRFFSLLMIATLSTPTAARELQKSPRLTCEVGEWTESGYVAPSEEVKIEFHSQRKGKFTEWRVTAVNRSSELCRLRLRWQLEAGAAGGDYWDGFALTRRAQADTAASTNRYVFPVATYSRDGHTALLGYAPQTISSRFERTCRIADGKTVLEWDGFLALHPGQREAQFFLSAELSAARTFTEAIEEVYLAYPASFRPVTGADPRIFGEGGYHFASEATRLYQLEESRRLGLNWEWCYAPFQKPGDIWPDKKHWDAKSGYSIERTQNESNHPGTVSDWLAYNQRRFQAGDRATAMFYYYLPQYCDVGMVKSDFPDSIWRKPDGQTLKPIHGWIKSGAHAQYAWPGQTSYGKHLRSDLAALWSHFPIAGFAMDMTLGDMPYAGDALPRETGKAFDDQGRVFMTEGVAVAQCMEYTKRLPPHADGRRAASIANEPITWLPIFHADAIMHEMPPYDRGDIVPARRLLAGQKPMSWWKGYKEEQILDWQRLTPEQFQRGLSGIVDYVILASLRYGAVPPIFFVDGYADMRRWIPVLRELQRAGWRAASYTRIEGPGAPDPAEPCAESASVWGARYGDAEQSYLTFSAPDPKGFAGHARIETGRFGAGGAIYLEWDGTATTNEVAQNETGIPLSLKNRDPLVVRRIATLRASSPVTLTVERTVLPSQNIAYTFTPKTAWPKGATIQFANRATRLKTSKGSEPLVIEDAPPYFVLPDRTWLGRVDFGTDKEVRAVIVAEEADRAALEPALTHLQTYWEYYQTRRSNPDPRLWDMDNKLRSDLRLPVVANFRAPEVKKAKTVFVLGEQARRAIFPTGSRGADAGILQGDRDGSQLRISFEPTRGQSEAELILAFLETQDQRFPFCGVLDGRAWFEKQGLAGTVFHRSKQP